MCWMCDHPGSTREDYLDVIRAKMRKRGWTAQYVESERTPYAYTIGLSEYRVPELLVTGLSPERTVRFFDAVVPIAMRDDLPPLGGQCAVPDGPRIEVVEVERPDVHMPAALAILDCPMRALQLVWADERGRWPWDAGFHGTAGRQPVLGVRSGFC